MLVACMYFFEHALEEWMARLPLQGLKLNAALKMPLIELSCKRNLMFRCSNGKLSVCCCFQVFRNLIFFVSFTSIIFSPAE